MAITLTPEQEQQVPHLAELRGSGSSEEILTELLARAYDHEFYFAENREELSMMLEEAIEEADRGDLLTPEEAKAQIEAMKRDFLSKRSAA